MRRRAAPAAPVGGVGGGGGLGGAGGQFSGSAAWRRRRRYRHQRGGGEAVGWPEAPESFPALPMAALGGVLRQRPSWREGWRAVAEAAGRKRSSSIRLRRTVVAAVAAALGGKLGLWRVRRRRLGGTGSTGGFGGGGGGSWARAASAGWRWRWRRHSAMTRRRRFRRWRRWLLRRPQQ